MRPVRRGSGARHGRVAGPRRQQRELRLPADHRRRRQPGLPREDHRAGGGRGRRVPARPSPSGRPSRTGATPTAAPARPSKVGDPFRSPEEWAAAGRGRHLKFSFINRDGAKLRARLYAPPGTAGRYPAITFTPGLQSYNEVNSWFPQGMAEAGYVVLIIDPQGQGDSESCGHRPDGTQTTCPATNQPNDTRSAIDFILSTPTQPYPWAQGVNAAGTPTYNPFWQADRPSSTSASPATRSARSRSRRSRQEDARVDAAISYDNLDLSLPAGVAPPNPDPLLRHRLRLPGHRHPQGVPTRP